MPDFRPGATNRRLRPDETAAVMKRLVPFPSRQAELAAGLKTWDWHRVLDCIPKNTEEVFASNVEPPGDYKPEGEGPSYRWHAFNVIEPYLTDCEYWELLGRVWTECEKPITHERGLHLFYPTLRNNGFRCYMMQPLEQHSFDTLPDEFQVFRGGNAEGWSWTLVQECADAFVETEAAIEVGIGTSTQIEEVARPDKPAVHSAMCRRSDALALFLRKGEAEIVVDWKKLRAVSGDS